MEDETCMLDMSIGDDKVARFFALHSSAPEIVKELTRQLIKQTYPTAMIGLNIPTGDIIEKNRNVSMLSHQAAIIGYDLRSPNGADDKL